MGTRKGTERAVAKEKWAIAKEEWGRVSMAEWTGATP